MLLSDSKDFILLNSYLDNKGMDHQNNIWYSELRVFQRLGGTIHVRFCVYSNEDDVKEFHTKEEAIKYLNEKINFIDYTY